MPNITDPTIQAYLKLISDISLIVAMISSFIAYKAYKKNVTWNRMNASFNYLSSVTLAKQEEETLAALGGVYTFIRTDPLTPMEAAAIFGDQKKYLVVKELLNIFDNYAIAISTGALHPEVAYQIRCARLLRHYSVFKPFVQLVRQQHNNDEIWIYFEIVAEEWNERRRKDLSHKEDRRKKIADRVRRKIARGTRIYG